MFFSISRNFYAPVNLDKATWQSAVFEKIGLVVISFGYPLAGELQPIFGCFVPNFKLKYEDSENIKADRVSIVVFKLRQIKSQAFFLGYPV